MPTTIRQSVIIDNALPEELYDAYLDPQRHSQLVNAPASISNEVGAPFWVFADDAVRGHNLLMVPRQLIVQAWRAKVFAEADPDSVLTLSFAAAGGASTRIDLVQIHVPDHARQIISDGWHTNYWNPWRAHFGAGNAALAQ